ncbi:cation transporter [Tropheryma whipplei]|nr:heavy metal-associated domain-containing protein [Tropheryma whipplei]
MTCASCAREIEKKLKSRGISASVDFATGSALLTAPGVLTCKKQLTW